MPISHKKPPGTNLGHRKQRLTPLHLAMQPEMPPPPAGLLKASRDRWEAYWRSDVARALDVDSDLPRLVRWVQHIDEYERVSKVFQRSRLVRGSTGQPVLNPLAAYLATLDHQIDRAETAFGMNPMARLRLGITLGEAHRSLQDMNRAMEDEADDDDERFAVIEGIEAQASDL